MRKFNLEQAIEILEQTPFTVKSLLGNLSEDWTYNKENSDSWSPFDIIGHYIQGEKTDWIKRAEIILAQSENRTFEPFDRFAQFSSSNEKTLNELLGEFIDLRSKNLETLKSWKLSGKQLELKGIHPEFGEITLEQLIST